MSQSVEIEAPGSTVLLHIEENLQQAGHHAFGIRTTAEHPRWRSKRQHWQARGGIMLFDHGLKRFWPDFVPIARE